jgi:hypothetical protein
MVVLLPAGGAWIIGYKAWGALLARRLCLSGVIVFCLDYRNFPTSAQNVRTTPHHTIPAFTQCCSCCVACISSAGGLFTEKLLCSMHLISRGSLYQEAAV